MADFLDKKRAEMEKRLKELKPMVEEHDRLEAAIAALGGVTGSRSRRASSSKGRSSAGGGRRRSTGTGKRGRPKGSGKRGKQCAALVKKNPGITIPEIAKKIGIKQNYLYRVMPALEKEGLVTKKGKGWYPTAKA